MSFYQPPWKWNLNIQAHLFAWITCHLCAIVLNGVQSVGLKKNDKIDMQAILMWTIRWLIICVKVLDTHILLRTPLLWRFTLCNSFDHSFIRCLLGENSKLKKPTFHWKMFPLGINSCIYAASFATSAI